jgi:hypothetical protein
MRPPSTTRPPGRLGSGSLASRSSPRRERTPLLHLGKVMKITSLSLGEHCSCMTATSGLAVCGGDAPPGWVAQRTAPAAPRSAGPWSGRTRSPPPQTAYRRRPRCARCSGGPGRSVRAAMGWCGTTTTALPHARHRALGSREGQPAARHRAARCCASTAPRSTAARRPTAWRSCRLGGCARPSARTGCCRTPMSNCWLPLPAGGRPPDVCGIDLRLSDGRRGDPARPRYREEVPAASPRWRANRGFLGGNEAPRRVAGG